MAKGYKPSAPFNVPMKLLVPVTTMSYGVANKAFSDPADSDLFFGSFRTFGGTESMRDDVYTIVDTGVIDTWYRPEIKANCQIYLCDTEQVYDIISDPEDIDFRHQYLRFKVRKAGGKA